MEIRPATTDDVAAIQQVARDSWEREYADIVTRETATESVEEWYGEDAIREDVTDPLKVVLVAEDGGEVVGFSHALLSTSEWVGTIMRLYVHPDHRRAGIGTELLDHTVETLLAEGADRVQAFVLVANEQGNDFYRSAGFERVDAGETSIGGEFYEENVYAYEPEESQG